MSIVSESMFTTKVTVVLESKRDGQKYRQKINLTGVTNIIKLVQFLPLTKQCIGEPTRIIIDLK